mmetsp:Transcript_8788/g.7774  ORF Transcript_8788/g.7774 Transcript_8788/m.7774 type:complete len:213 (-) Transcript_8788:79-717(-)
MNFYQKESKITRTKHLQLLDKAFDFLIDNLYPVSKFNYWKHLDENYNPSYDLIKKFNKLKKFERTEFIEKHNFNELDQIVAAFEPGKKQFDFIIDSMLKKELQIKNIIKEAIKCLAQAKEKILDANVEIYAHQYFLLFSDILTDKQLTDVMLIGDAFKNDDIPLSSIFGIKKEKGRKSMDLTKDLIMGKYVKKRLTKEKRVFEFSYNKIAIS